MVKMVVPFICWPRHYCKLHETRWYRWQFSFLCFCSLFWRTGLSFARSHHVGVGLWACGLHFKLESWCMGKNWAFWVKWIIDCCMHAGQRLESFLSSEQLFTLLFSPFLKVEYLILWTDCLFNRCWERRIPEVWASVDLRLDLKLSNEELFG